MRDVTAFSVGDIIKTTLAVYFNNLPAFLPLSLIVLAPSFLIVLLPESSSFNTPPVLPDPTEDPAAASEAMLPFYVVMFREGLVGWLCPVLLHAAFAYGVVRHLRGGHAGFSESLAQFARRLVPVLGVMVIVAIATGIGFLLLVVPGVWLTVVLWVSLPAVVVERSRLGAIQRSAELTRGFRGPIFGLVLILWVADFVVLSVSDWIVSAVVSHALLAWCVIKFVAVVTAGIYATAVSVTYHDLRVLKDGVDTRSVSNVFE